MIVDVNKVKFIHNTEVLAKIYEKSSSYHHVVHFLVVGYEIHERRLPATTKALYLCIDFCDKSGDTMVVMKIDEIWDEAKNVDWKVQSIDFGHYTTRLKKDEWWDEPKSILTHLVSSFLLH